MPSRLSSIERARPIQLDEELPEAFQDQYRAHVKETLIRVFKTGASRADELVGKAKRKLKDLEEKKGRHTVLYHASPLEIAVSLARVVPITHEQKEA